MIKAHELRSGNLVIKKSFGSTPNHIDTVDGAYIKWVEENGAECYGISLTPEILRKFGFEYIKNEEMSECLGGDMSLYKKDKIEIFLPEGSCNILMNYEFENKVEYLHQLENLYFALTGKELQ